MMKGSRILIGLTLLFFVGGFGFLYHIWSYQNDQTHFADELIPFTDVTRPEKNKVQVKYKDKEYNLIGWDVVDVYTVLNRGDGSRVKLIFKKEPKTQSIQFTFKDTADITVFQAESDPDIDKVIIKYHDMLKNTTKYYTVEGLVMFKHLVEVLEPKKE